MIKYIIGNMDILYNYLFLSRGNTNSRFFTSEPTSSLLMTEMSQSNITPILSSYNRILGTIVANKHRDGIFFKLLTLNENRRSQSIVVDRERLSNRAYQSIHEGFSSFIWRGYEYERISYFLEAVRANTDAMNYSICLGFTIWYSLMPTLLLGFVHYDYSQFLCPENLRLFKESTRDWSTCMIQGTTEMAMKLCGILYNEQINNSTLDTGGASVLENETFDTMVRRGEEVPRNLVLKKLVIACLALCILSTISYTTVCGTELSKQFLEGQFHD